MRGAAQITRPVGFRRLSLTLPATPPPRHSPRTGDSAAAGGRVWRAEAGGTVATLAEPRNALRDDTPARGRRRRLTRGTGIALGAVVGLAVGIAVLLIVDGFRTSGHDDSPLVLVFGIPTFTAIAGGVLLGLLSGVPEHAVVDAPVRERRFARSGRAATSAEGQLPGSPVEPRVAPPGTAEHDDAVTRRP